MSNASCCEGYRLVTRCASPHVVWLDSSYCVATSSMEIPKVSIRAKTSGNCTLKNSVRRMA